MKVTNKTTVPIRISGTNIPSIELTPQEKATVDESTVHNVYVVNSSIGKCQFVIYHGESTDAYVSRRELKSRLTVLLVEDGDSEKSETCVEVIEF